MHIQKPLKPNGVLVVCDQRQKSDLNLEQSTGKPHVMAVNAVLRGCFGPTYAGVTRLALYEYGEKPTPKSRGEARAAYRQWLADNAGKYKAMIVVPTPSKAMGDDGTVKGTQVWRDLAPPDSLEEMRGAWWRSHGLLVCPVFAPLGCVGQVQLHFMSLWCQAGLQLATGQAEVLRCKPVTEPDVGMLEVLNKMHNQPLAVDIETIPNQDVITAIGVATAEHAVSVPWDAFVPACGSGPEPALEHHAQGKKIAHELKQLLAAPTSKLLQNGVYDAPLLAERGLTMGGNLHDTLAMHAIAYPESRHALQIAAATQLLVPPWKSLFKPQGPQGKKLSKDTPEYWYWNAKTLRDYNAKDAFYTWHLGQSLAWKVGVTL